MNAEEIIAKILSTHPEVSREEILERLEEARKKTGGLISDDVLLRMVAVEFGVETTVDKASTHGLMFKDLVPGLSDVTVAGRVVAFFPSKTFAGRKKGKVAGLLVADESGVLRVVLWNDKADIVESGKVRTGQIVRFSHGYTREGLGGKVELHIGEKSEVEIDPKDVEIGNYPTIAKFLTKIKELSKVHKGKRVNLAGVVKELFPSSTFQRSNSTSGKLMRFIIADGTDEVAVVVWNDKVDEVEKFLKKGVKLNVVNGKVKSGLGDGLEVHVDSETYIEVAEYAGEFLKIADLKEGLNCISVKGEVASKPITREVKTSRGENVKVTVFEIKDETGKTWVSAWRKHAEKTGNLKIGEKITIKNAYVKKGFGNQPEITTRSATTIDVSSENNNSRT
ncbi:MAG: OB-fold nucleic acid binding domain-containing protein [Candidatus Bathyarchaeia archaeon]